MKHLLSLACAFLYVLLLTGCGKGEETATMDGWYLQAENGAHFVVTGDGEPLHVSGQAKNGGLFDDLTSGDRVRITHDGIAETYPGQAGAYSCKLLEEGPPEDIPAETLAALEELGYTFDFHTHTPSGKPQTVAAPVSGY